MSDFAKTITEAYAAEGATIDLGRGLRAPASRMGPADDVEGAAKASLLFAEYGTREENESAREKLAARLEKPKEPKKPRPTKKGKETATATGGGADALGKFLNSREGKSLQKKVMRGMFGMLRKAL